MNWWARLTLCPLGFHDKGYPWEEKAAKRTHELGRKDEGDGAGVSVWMVEQYRCVVCGKWVNADGYAEKVHVSRRSSDD